MAKSGWGISFNDKDLQRGLSKLSKSLDRWMGAALEEMGDTLLLLSRAEVPHDVGTLQASGNVDKKGLDTVEVSYNTEYAAFQHEGGDDTRTIRNYQKGRKKKYLEDPLKNNMSKWERIANKNISRKLSGKI